MPWQEIHCDTIGPWTIDLQARKVTFNAMTIIDACTNLADRDRDTFSMSFPDPNSEIKIGHESESRSPKRIELRSRFALHVF